MFRTLSATHFNKIANDPQVRPYLGGEGPLNFTAAIANPYNFAFLTEQQNAGHIFHNKATIVNGKLEGQGIYEVHTFSLPEARGKGMLKLMQDARAYMFLQTDCIELQTFVPQNQPNTYLWAQLAGFRENFKRSNCFNLNGNIVGGSYLSLTYGDWVLKDKVNLKIGTKFHEQIEHLELLTHKDCSIHNAWAGATVRSHNMPKAISEYNKWAVRTGFHVLQIVSVTPFMLDLGNAVLQLNADNSISILKANDECLELPSLLLAE